jgi:tripartite-type tricarboxylate transporter receptor subunit TctC
MKKIFSILLFSLSFHLVQAQSFANYPEKNITIIVGFPLGTATA